MVSLEEFREAMILFISLTLDKFFKLLEGLFKKDHNYVFIPVGELSQFFWKLLEDTQPLQLPI